MRVGPSRAWAAANGETYLYLLLEPASQPTSRGTVEIIMLRQSRPWLKAVENWNPQALKPWPYFGSGERKHAN
jgi:hypothetical protein